MFADCNQVSEQKTGGMLARDDLHIAAVGIGMKVSFGVLWLHTLIIYFSLAGFMKHQKLGNAGVTRSAQNESKRFFPFRKKIHSLLSNVERKTIILFLQNIPLLLFFVLNLLPTVTTPQQRMKTHSIYEFDSLALQYSQHLGEENIILDDSVLSYVGSWKWGETISVDVKDNYAFMGNGALMHVVDISNPSQPKIVGEYPSSAADIEIRGTRAYVASGGLKIFDIAKPKYPRLLGKVSHRLSSTRLSISDTIAYLLSFGLFTASSITVFDITNPSIPFKVGMTGTTERSTMIASKGNYIYAGSYRWPAIVVYNNNFTPAPPKVDDVMIGAYPVYGTVVDTLLYISTVDGLLKLYSVSNPSQPVELYSVNVTDSNELNTFIIKENLLYAGSYGRIDVLDITDPMQMRKISSAPLQDFPYGATYALSANENVLLAACVTGLFIFDISNLGSMHQISYLPTGGTGQRGMAIKDTIAYVGAGGGILSVLNISNPAQITQIRAVGLQGENTDVAIDSSFLYVNHKDGVFILDIVNPTNPVLITDIIPESTGVGDIQIGNQKLFISTGDELLIYDVRNKDDIFLTGIYPMDDNTFIVDNNLLYFAGYNDGLTILDVSSPDSIRKVNRAFISGTGIAKKDSLLYVHADGMLYILNVSNPVSPDTLSSMWIPCYCAVAQMYVSGNYCYLRTHGKYLNIIDISDNYSPRLISSIETNSIYDMDFKDEFVYICQRSWGLNIYKNNLLTSVDEKLYTPTSVQLYQNYPNPFNPITVIGFQNQQYDWVSIKVYDILGKEITTLLNRKLEPGTHQLLWNAEDVPSGIYLYRMTVGSYSVTKKLLIVR